MVTTKFKCHYSIIILNKLTLIDLLTEESSNAVEAEETIVGKPLKGVQLRNYVILLHKLASIRLYCGIEIA